MKRIYVIVLMLLAALTIAQTGFAMSTPVALSSYDGHCYEAVPVEGGINWNDAKLAAENLSLPGIPAHLAAINSAGEQAFLETLTLPYHPWIGAFQQEGAAAPDVGWQWVTGEPWSYDNWWEGFWWTGPEPNDNDWIENGEEQVAHFTDGNVWNDWPPTNINGGYLAEFDSCGYGFVGFLPPADNPVNSGKAGRTYPIKWQLTGAGDAYVGDLSAITSLVAAPSSACLGSVANDGLLQSIAGESSLHYDAAANQFIYNWRTPGTPGCYALELTLASGQVRTAYFELR